MCLGRKCHAACCYEGSERKYKVIPFRNVLKPLTYDRIPKRIQLSNASPCYTNIQWRRRGSCDRLKNFAGRGFGSSAYLVSEDSIRLRWKPNTGTSRRKWKGTDSLLFRRVFAFSFSTAQGCYHRRKQRKNEQEWYRRIRNWKSWNVTWISLDFDEQLL